MVVLRILPVLLFFFFRFKRGASVFAGPSALSGLLLFSGPVFSRPVRLVVISLWVGGVVSKHMRMTEERLHGGCCADGDAVHDAVVPAVGPVE
eukprot:12318280-Alexandrium_andersonii.AAC.1